MRRGFECFRCGTWVPFGAERQHTFERCAAITRRRKRWDEISRRLEKRACLLTVSIVIICAEMLQWAGFSLLGSGLLIVALILLAWEFDERAGA